MVLLHSTLAPFSFFGRETEESDNDATADDGARLAAVAGLLALFPLRVQFP